MTFTKPLARGWGERIRGRRLELGLSLEALAEKTGIDAGHLSRGERGLAGFGDEHRIRLARGLSVQVSDLFPYPDTTVDSASPDPVNPSSEEGDA